MWNIAWALGMALACSLAIINGLFLELSEEREKETVKED